MEVAEVVKEEMQKEKRTKEVTIVKSKDRGTQEVATSIQSADAKEGTSRRKG